MYVIGAWEHEKYKITSRCITDCCKGSSDIVLKTKRILKTVKFRSKHRALFI